MKKSILVLIFVACVLVITGCQKSEERILQEKAFCIAYKTYILTGAGILMDGKRIDDILSIDDGRGPAKGREMAPGLMKYVAENIGKLPREEVEAELDSKCEELY